MKKKSKKQHNKNKPKKLFFSFFLFWERTQDGLDWTALGLVGLVPRVSIFLDQWLIAGDQWAAKLSELYKSYDFSLSTPCNMSICDDAL